MEPITSLDQFKRTYFPISYQTTLIREERYEELISHIVENCLEIDMKLFRDNLPQTLFSKKISDTMRFANYISNNFKRSNIREISKELHFSEKNILESNFDFLKEKLNLLELEIEVDNFKSEPSRPKIEII